MNINSKYGEVKIFNDFIEEEAMSQIMQMVNSPLGENANIRIMSDCHAGAGCVIGTTMLITDKVCPNLVGVDIGCGVDLVKTNIDFSNRFEELDKVIRENIPYGMDTHKEVKQYNDFYNLKCWDKLKKDTQNLAMTALGTLGGGNHFIEAYNNGYLCVHSGSRNIGWKVAEYYQKLAEKNIAYKNSMLMKERLKTIEPKNREEFIKNNKVEIDKSLSYLEEQDMQDYLHDIKILQKFAVENRKAMLKIVADKMNGKVEDSITSIHNYIDTENMILRKGAISAQLNETLVIPMNMRDGLLVCKGKGNKDWNYSAPHGAGRLYSRSKAKETFNIEEYKESMKGIFSTCINENTIDEAPFVYKNFEEIMHYIEPTVEIVERLLPIYNFKAN